MTKNRTAARKTYDSLLTRKEAAEMLNISERTLHRLIAAREIPVVRINRMVRIRVTALEDLAEARESRGPAKKDTKSRR